MTGMAREKIFANGRKLRLVSGDITRIAVDAMANAANSALAGGGGVDGAIHDAGGPSIMAELDRIRAAQGGCPTGSAVATGAGRLPAKHVFHAVGPVFIAAAKTAKLRYSRLATKHVSISPRTIMLKL
jgi:O-acetyl-ADP-ribose deacetylase (regulator of RNase III)